MYSGHPFQLVLLGFAGGAVAVAEGLLAVAVVSVIVGLLGAVWDWYRFDNDPPGERIASSLVAGLLGVTGVVLSLAYRPWWTAAAIAFLAYVAARIFVEVRRLNRHPTAQQ